MFYHSSEPYTEQYILPSHPDEVQVDKKTENGFLKFWFIIFLQAYWFSLYQNSQSDQKNSFAHVQW